MQRNYVREIQQVLDASDLASHLHEVCCGAQSYLWYATRQASASDSTTAESFRTMLDALEEQANWLLANDIDPSRPPRLAGMLQVIRALLGLAPERAAFADATTAFEKSWRLPRPAFGELPAHALQQDELYTKYGGYLAMNTVAGWLIYDVVWHWQNSQPGAPGAIGAGHLLARESIAVLTTGEVLHLVAEVLPGPARLVTPDWWPMGLIRFPSPAGPTENETFSDFLAATQRVMRAVAAQRQLPHRIRWRLEYRGEGNPWQQPITGRSAEAAAALVTRAVCEAASVSAKAPLLDPTATITACVQGMDQPGADFDFSTAALKKVDDNSLPDKLAAAQRAGLRTVFLAEDQGSQRLNELAKQFEGLSVSAWPTLEDAYDPLLYDSKYVQAYQRHIVSTWNRQWSEQETPREPGPGEAETALPG
jgi:hypothetical protein